MPGQGSLRKRKVRTNAYTVTYMVPTRRFRFRIVFSAKRMQGAHSNDAKQPTKTSVFRFLFLIDVRVRDSDDSDYSDGTYLIPLS